VRGISTAAVVAVAGAVLIVTGMLALVAALILGLSYLGLPSWAAAALVAVLLAGGGGWAVWWAIGRFGSVTLVPVETIASLKEDVRWLKAQMRK
jgi:hypothetical protein